MGLVEGVWMVGVIDEIQMLEIGTCKVPMLIDTKTRMRHTIPAEPQQRNGKYVITYCCFVHILLGNYTDVNCLCSSSRLQLMCYKFLLDCLICDGFSTRQFFDFFSLNPHSILSEEIADSTASSGFTAKVELLTSSFFFRNNHDDDEEMILTVRSGRRLGRRTSIPCKGVGISP